MPVAAIPNSLAAFQCHLIGTWANEDFPGTDTGGTANPYSYCVMPLPQDPPGYILKNFSLYETVHFDGDATVSSPATAPNRGNTDLQVPTALFYEQNVSFAEGPGKGGIVHVENGAWLYLRTGDKLTDPYPPPAVPGGTGIRLTEPAGNAIVKQLSVPHGNSIIAIGSFDPPATGKPSIPVSASTLPTPIDPNAPSLDTQPYGEQITTPPENYQNPSPDLTENPNKSLQDGVDALDPDGYIHWSVKTPENGGTLNIPFEERAADILDYTAAYWLLSKDGGRTYKYLAYFQAMNMRFQVSGHHYSFPHVTTNIVTKQKSGEVPSGNCEGMQEGKSALDRAADMLHGVADRIAKLDG